MKRADIRVGETYVGRTGLPRSVREIVDYSMPGVPDWLTYVHVGEPGSYECDVKTFCAWAKDQVKQDIKRT